MPSRSSATKPRAAMPRPVDDSWPGSELNSEETARFQDAMKRHKEIHTLEDATYSVQNVCDILKEFDSKNVIPNKNAMQICLQHCFLKSASFCAEHMCFDAANFAVSMMERQKCNFDLSRVIEIVMATSLRSDFANIVSFVQRLITKTLTHIPENERSFLSRHIIFALAERKAAVDESLHRSETFAERGLMMDWDNSSAQEFYLYNSIEEGKKVYRPVEGYGFAKKNLVALLSMELENDSQQHYEYKLRRDGAFIDVVKANDGEPLVVRVRTQVTVPFKEDATYRLDNMDIDELQAKRIMEALQVLGRDTQSSCRRLSPHPYLCQMLHLPPEEPYVVRIILQPKVAPLTRELEVKEYGNEPIRVRSIGSGVFLEWNASNPGNAIRVGDRILRVNDASDKESILEEIQHAHQWSKYELKVTFMRKVKARQSDTLDGILPNAERTHEILLREEAALNERLNPSQVEALRAASTQRLSLIQGPPGTGKTTTAVELLEFLLEHKIVPTPILVSGHTNAAVDNILVGLAKKGRRVVRIGEESKVRLECQPYLLGEKDAAEPWKAEVICATCSGSGSGIFHREGIKCHTVLIDEASQATESSCLIPLCRAAQHLILVGDQCQLEPFVKSEYAKIEDLGKSLFNRFCQQGLSPTMLNTQYRMNPSICAFPSEAFYNGQLLSGVGRTERRPTSYWEWPSRWNPVCFIDAKEGTESSSEGQIEKKNELEVSLVLSALKELMCDPELQTLSEDGTYPVGIVTPYAAQRECITKELVREGFADAKGKLLVEANSVDGFQGREKEIIIFSAVRANSEGSVGFLHDWRRINVMLTRAKCGLIVIGHRETLETDFYWSNWLKWVAMQGCIMGERASGNWVPRCLVEDEWVMKPKSIQVSSNVPAAEVVVAAHSASCENDTDSSWDDDYAGDVSDNLRDSSDFASQGTTEIDFEQSEASFSTESVMSCELAESWEDLLEVNIGPLERLLLQKQTANASIEDVDTSVDLEQSEASFSTESPLSRDVSESWDDFETDSACGPLDRMVHQSTDFSISITSAVEFSSRNLAQGRDPNARAESIAAISHAETVNEYGINGLQQAEKKEPNNHNDAARVGKRHSSSVSRDLSIASAPHELPEDNKVEQVPEAASMKLLKTVDWFECPEADLQPSSTAAADVSTSMPVLQDPAPPMVAVWMPMLVPMTHVDAGYSPAFNPFSAATLQPSYLLHSHIQESSSWTDIPASDVHACMPQLDAQNKLEKATVSQHSLSQPQLQSIELTYDESNRAYRIVWHADARKLHGNDCSVVSPDVELSLTKQKGPVAFKLMLLPAGNGFKKSQGRGFVKFKCNSELCNGSKILTLVCKIGQHSVGPVIHDFSSHPVANLQEQPFRLHSTEDSLSKALCIRLDVIDTCEFQSPLADSKVVDNEQNSSRSLASTGFSRGMVDNTMQSTDAVSVAHGKRRSEAGRQRQRARWQSRKEEYAKRSGFASAAC